MKGVVSHKGGLSMNAVNWQKLVSNILKDLLLSQSELAELCHVSQQAVSSWKNGMRVPGIYARRKLMEIVKNSPDKEHEISLVARDSIPSASKPDARSNALISAFPDLLFIQTAAGTFIDFVMNDPKAFPLDPSFYIGRNMKDFLDPEMFDEFQDAFRKVLDTGRMEVREYALSLAGKRYYFETRMIRYGDDRILTLARDISERKNIEKIKNDLNMIMHHDLKTPLNSIIGIPPLLEEELGHLLDERQKKLLRSISEAGSHMIDTVNHAINMFKMEQGLFEFKPELIDVIPIVKRVKEHLISLMKIRNSGLTLHIDGKQVPLSSSFTVKTEELLFYSLASNLIKNAIEHSPSDSEVMIDFSHRDRHVVMEVRNRGEVPEKVKKRFFDKFVSSREKPGAGIGTYSAKLIAEAHGGTIVMESSPGGTILRVQLPK